MHSPVYEFPYSGNRFSPVPFLNYDAQVLQPYNHLSTGGSMYNYPTTFTAPNYGQVSADLGNNIVVYQVPNDISLDTLLRELGVNVNSLHRTSPNVVSYPRNPTPIEFVMPRRRRRIVCREVSDSDDDEDYDRRRSRRRQRHQSPNYGDNLSPSGVHNLLGNAWGRAAGASQMPPQGMPNINAQWQHMRNGPPSPPPATEQDRNAVSHAWNQATTATADKPGFLSSFFRRMKLGNASTDAPPPDPQARNAVANVFGAAQQGAPSMQPPPPPMQARSAVANVFGAAQQNAPQMPPPRGPPMGQMWGQMSAASPPPPMGQMWGQMNRAAAPPAPPPMGQMWGQMNRAAAPSPPPGPPMGQMWNQMTAAAPPPQGPPMGQMWGQMSGASPPPPQGSPMGQMWGQMSGASPPPPPPGPPMGQMWGQMSGASPPPQQNATTGAASRAMNAMLSSQR